MRCGAVLSRSLAIGTMALAIAVGCAVAPVMANAAMMTAGGIPTALASNGNRSVAVTVGANEQIYYDYWDLGGSGHGWTQLPGLQTTTAAAVDLVDDGDYMFVEARGLNGELYVDQGTPGGGFVGWEPTGFYTNVAPALGGEGNRSVIVAVGTDGLVYYDYWDLGGSGHGWARIPGASQITTAPAVNLVDNGTYMFVAIRGVDGQLYGNQGTPGGGFVGWAASGFYTNLAPALGAEGNRSVIVAVGTDDFIYYDYWDLGGGGHGFTPIPGGWQTTTGPGVNLVDDGDYMFVYIRGFNGQLYLNQGTPGGGFVGWHFVSSPV